MNESELNTAVKTDDICNIENFTAVLKADTIKLHFSFSDHNYLYVHLKLTAVISC